MNQIQLTDVVIENRIREDLGDEELAELAESLKTNGQIQPIVIDRDNKLVVGERRIRAAQKLGWQTIGFIYRDNLDPLMRKVIEFDENSKRKQLTWVEAAKAIEEIHRLQSEKNFRWEQKDTASLLGVSEALISEHLELARMVSSDNKAVLSNPTFRGAIKAARHQQEIAILKELAKRRPTEIGISIGEAFSHGRLINDDCRNVLSKVETETVDLIITDPPWGIDIANASQWAQRWIHEYDDKAEPIMDVLKVVIPELYRVLRPGCHLYIFYPIQFTNEWTKMLEDAGFVVRNRPLVWFKTGPLSITSIYTNFISTYEVLLWAFKPDQGVSRSFQRPVADAYAQPRQRGEFHEAEKPVDLLKEFIEASSALQELVLDPFAGGGSSLVAASELGRYFIGIEQDEVSYTKCRNRLRQIESASNQGDEGENV